MLRPKILPMFSIAILLCAGCVAVSTATHNSDVPPLTDTPFQFLGRSTSLPTLTPSSSPLPPTTTSQIIATPSSSVTDTPQPVIEQHSVVVGTVLPSDFTATGKLVLIGSDYLGYWLDLQTMERSMLPVTTDGIPLVSGGDDSPEPISPDREWLAYTERIDETSNQQLRIIASNGQQLSMLQPEGWNNVIGWLDNKRLVLTKQNHPDGTVMVYNPFAGVTQEISPSFPAIFPSGHFVSWAAWYAADSPFVIYDPAIARVAYIRHQDELSIYTLWNVESREILWEIDNISDGYRPSWSPNGEYLAISILPNRSSQGVATFILDRDGQEIRTFKTMGGVPAWSPDGLQIASWWDDPQPCPLEINYGPAIIDMQTRVINVYCMGHGYLRSISPIWSPDGRWLAVNNEYEDAFRVIIIDLAENRAFEVARDATVVGWMTTTP
jgi:hypothetical protein